MIVYKDKDTTFLFSIGRTRTGYTLSFRILYDDLTEKETWSTTGAREIDNGYYGVVTSVDEEMNGYIEYKVEKAGETTLYGVDPITVVDDIFSKISTIYKVETGRWKIVNNQMIFYDTSDDTTPLLTFNLKDSNGNATSTSPTERTPA